MTAAEKLHAYTAKQARPAAVEAPWAPPNRDMLPVNAKLLAVDQSLAATGVVAMIVHQGWPIVRHAAKIAGVTELVGNEGNLAKAESLEDEFDGLLDFWGLDSTWAFIHEAVPPAKGGLMRTDSSLLAASVTRRVARRRKMARLPSAEPRSHALLMTGDRNAKKAARRRAFPAVVEALGLDATDLRNEATRDAASVATYGLVTHSGQF